MIYRRDMSTGTSDLTMAELARVAAERYGDAKAAMFLRDGEWAELTSTSCGTRSATWPSA